MNLLYKGQRQEMRIILGKRYNLDPGGKAWEYDLKKKKDNSPRISPGIDPTQSQRPDKEGSSGSLRAYYIWGMFEGETNPYRVL